MHETAANAMASVAISHFCGAGVSRAAKSGGSGSLSAHITVHRRVHDVDGTKG